MTILKFWATWCSQCKQLSKVIEEFKKLHPEIEIVSVDVEENEKLTARYKVTSLPLLVKLDDFNEEIGRKQGMMTLNQLEKFILDA